MATGENENTSKKNYTIYTAVLNDLEYVDNIWADSVLYNILSIVNKKAVYVIPILIISIITLIPIIIVGIGKSSKQKGINLNWYDKILVELAVLIAVFIGCVGICFVASVNGMNNTMATFVLGISLSGMGLVIIYMSCIMLFETIVKRLKTHTFIKTTFAYWLYLKINDFVKNIKITKKLILYFIIFTIANLICFGIMESDKFSGTILIIILYVATFGLLSKSIKSFVVIKSAIHELYSGNTDVEVDEKPCKRDK